MTRPRICIAEPRDLSPTALAILRDAGDVEVATCGPDEVAAALRTCDVFWFRLGHRIGATNLGDDARCRTLATPVTGLDHIDLDLCHRRGVTVLSLRGETDFLRTVRATAELTLALALALPRRILSAARSVQEGRWDRDAFRGHELHGKTAGIVGVGRLGTLVAGYFTALGMRVIGFDPRPDFPPHVPRAASLIELLGDADLVSLHVSYDLSTHHLIGAAELAAMRTGAWLVNTSRGSVLDEVALLGALQGGHLAGAALDVLAGEPEISIGHPLLAWSREHDNLLIVPHLGGNTFESFEKVEVFLARKVAAHLRARATA